MIGVLAAVAKSIKNAAADRLFRLSQWASYLEKMAACDMVQRPPFIGRKVPVTLTEDAIIRPGSNHFAQQQVVGGLNMGFW